MVEVRFKPADVGTVADGAITDIKINAGAAIDQSKLDLTVIEADVATKVTGTGTTGDKDITKIGWDSATSEVVIDHEA